MPIDPALLEFLRSQPDFAPTPEFMLRADAASPAPRPKAKYAPVSSSEVARLYGAGQEAALPAGVLERAESLLSREREQRARGAAAEAGQLERQRQLAGTLGNAPPIQPELAAPPAPPPPAPSPLATGPLGEMGFTADSPVARMGMGATETPLDTRLGSPMTDKGPLASRVTFDPELEAELAQPEEFQALADDEAIRAKHEDRINRQRELLGIVRSGELLGRSLAGLAPGMTRGLTPNNDIGVAQAEELKRLQGLATPNEKAFAAEQDIMLPEGDIDLDRARAILGARRDITGRSGITPEQRDRQLDISAGRLAVSEQSLDQRKKAQGEAEERLRAGQAKIPPASRIILDNQRGVFDDVRRMRDAFKRTGGDTGPVAGRITRLLQRIGNIGEDDAVLLSETENLLAQFGKTISGGAIAESEFKRLMAQLPQLQQKPKTFSALLDRFERMARDRVTATLEGLEATKHDTKGYRQIFANYGLGRAPRAPAGNVPAAVAVPKLQLPASDTAAIQRAEELGVDFEIIE